MDRLLEATHRAERDHFWFRGFRQFVTPFLAAAAGGRRGLQLLDCGCGTGANLALLERYGKAVGIDLTMSGLEYARRDGRRLLARATAAQLPFADAQFDVVTSFDVIYGLDDADERQALSEMARILKPGGALVLNVAALPILRGDHSVLGRERRRYTKRMLRERLERAGLPPLRITYTNASLFPPLLAVRLAQRLRGFAETDDQATAEITVPARPVNLLLTALLHAEARVVRHLSLPIGSSLLVLSRKQ
jgi:ubiquinone/menaquinone biosynthesis C-methylase UbiE